LRLRLKLRGDQSPRPKISPSFANGRISSDDMAVDFVHTVVYPFKKEARMKMINVAKVFKNGNSRAVRIPKDFCAGERELLIQRIGNTLVLTPVNDPWQFFKNSLEEFSDDFFKDGRNQPDAQERKAIFPDAE
jgi:antitoxin VapB